MPCRLVDRNSYNLSYILSYCMKDIDLGGPLIQSIGEFVTLFRLVGGSAAAGRTV